MTERQRVLAGLLLATGALALLILSDVVTTVFFAITMAYVLYPLRRWLHSQGLGARIAAAVCTVTAAVFGLGLVTPVAWALFERRERLFAYLRDLPETITLTFGGVAVPIDVGTVVGQLQTAVGRLAVAAAGEAAVIALKGFLFFFLLYVLLLRPSAGGTVADRLVPGRYRDVVARLHERTRETLVAIYVLQGATAIGTGVLAYAVFALLGYPSPLTLAVVAGVLQFIPVVGPSALVLLVAATDVAAGNVRGAVILTILGLVVIGFLPDAILRPQLAPYTAELPVSLYFVGFVGGVLSVGMIGFVAGPLVVALFVEVATLLAADRHSHQDTLRADPAGEP